MLLGLNIGVDVWFHTIRLRTRAHLCWFADAQLCLLQHEVAVCRSWVQMWASTTRSRTLLRS